MRASRDQASSASSRAILGREETLGDSVVDVRDQMIEEALDVHQAAALPLEAELGPRHDLEQLLQRSEPARQREEAVRERAHEGLALVHSVHDVQLRHALVRRLARHEVARNHADYLAPRVERGIGHDAHHADVAAAVDEAELRLAEASPNVLGGPEIGRPAPCARATEHADRSHAPSRSAPRGGLRPVV